MENDNRKSHPSQADPTARSSLQQGVISTKELDKVEYQHIHTSTSGSYDIHAYL